jgi:hypothetical protein
MGNGGRELTLNISTTCLDLKKRINPDERMRRNSHVVPQADVPLT